MNRIAVAELISEASAPFGDVAFERGLVALAFAT
jgi:hypothetical protein